MIEWFVFFGSLTATVLLGLPVVRAANSSVRSRHQPRDASGQRAPIEITRAYAPLDLGIDPVRWPSERPWVLNSTLKEAFWPSTHWDDEHFGRRGDGKKPQVEDGGFHAMSAREKSAERKAAERKAAPEAGVRPEASAPSAAPPKVEPARNRRQGGKAPKVIAVAPPAAAPSAGGQPPGLAELDQLITTSGLAGAVQEVMARTGWDFMKAAQYIAKARKAP